MATTDMLVATNLRMVGKGRLDLVRLGWYDIICYTSTNPIKFCGSPSDRTGDHRPGFDCNCSNEPLYMANIRNAHYQSILPIARPLPSSDRLQITTQQSTKKDTAQNQI